jgi:glycosyltransferase involved in cell wall biosynthesis
MIRLFLNGLAASAGGGLTYLRNVVPHLSAGGDVEATVAVTSRLRQELGDLPRISFIERESPTGTARRFWQEQTLLPGLIRQAKADVLVSAGNFALRRSPVPQILLSRNSLYTSSNFSRDVRARHDYKIWFDTRIKAILAKASIRWANCTVAPSQAFAEELRGWSGGNIVSIHHGFDREAFWREDGALPVEVQQKLDATKGSLRLLFVSHYNYYRNFETLLRALPELSQRLDGRVKLILTCSLRSEANPGSYQAEGAAALVRELGIGDNVVELGSVPYNLVHHVYQACDIYVTPAYTESFAHPLVEAMSAGMPVVASGLAVHREICGGAALYFGRFSPSELASRVLQVAGSAELAQQLSAEGRNRAGDFSWSKHVAEVSTLAKSLTGSKTG